MPLESFTLDKDDIALLQAQQSLNEGLRLCDESSPHAPGHCTRAIRLILDANLHEHADAATRKEARSTLSLAFQNRAEAVRKNPAGGDTKQIVPDARTALKYAAYPADKASAQLALISGLMEEGPHAELPEACARLEALLRKPLRRPKYRFFRPAELEPAVCAAIIEFARTPADTSRLARLVKQGVALEDAGEFGKAVAAYSRMLELIKAADLKECEPAWKARALRPRSRNLTMMKRHKEAIADAELAVQLVPGLSEGHVSLGQVHMLAGNDRAACLAHVRGAKANPSCVTEFVWEMRSANGRSQTFSEETLAAILHTPACAHCKRFIQKSLRRCGKCREAWYCCQEHQRADWRAHKAVCETVSAIPADWRAATGNREVDIVAGCAAARLSAEGSPCAWSLRDAPAWLEAMQEFAQKGANAERLCHLLRDKASFPLTLAAALVAFELDALSSVHVHVVNIDAETRTSLERALASGVTTRLAFPDLDLLFCGLSAPRAPFYLEQNGEAAQPEANGGPNTVTVQSRWGLWHESQRALPPPDLVVGFNVDLDDAAYEWPATLRVLVARNVPCVFTAKSERAYERALAAVRDAKASFAFHGRAPSPSPQPRCKLGGLLYDNAFWVAFRGGQA